MTAAQDHRRAGRLAVAVAVVAVLVSIGTPLLGLDVFAGTDLLEGFAPWDEVPPDAEVTNPLVSDLVDSSLPDRRVAVDRLRAGDLPMWQPYANGGRPLAALPNLGLLSPLNWPYLVLPLWYAPAVVQLLTLLVSLAGGLAWLRRVGVGWLAATLGAVTWTFSGFAVVYAGFPAGHIAALLPLGLWAADVATDRGRSWARVVPVALVVAAMWFEGFPQVTAFAVGAMGVWALATVLDRRGDVDDVDETTSRPSPVRWVSLALVAPLVGVVLGTMLAAVQLGPFVADTAALDLSAREQTVADHLPLGTALTVAAPTALGTATDGTWFGPLNELEVQSSLAVPALALAVVGLATTPRRRRWRVGLVTVTAAAAAALTWVGGPLLALAQQTPLFALADVHRVRVLVGVGVVLLAAQGLDRVLRGPRPGRQELWRLGPLLSVGAAGLGVVVWAARSLAPTPELLVALERATFVAVGIGVLTLAVVALAWWRPGLRHVAGLAVVVGTVAVVLPLPLRFWPTTDRALFYPDTPAHDVLAEQLDGQRLLTDGLVMLPGTTTYYRLRTAAAHAFPTPEWRDLLEAVDPAVYERLSPTFPAVDLTPAVAASPVLDRLAVSHLVVDPDEPVWDDTDAFDLVHTEAATIYERPSALPRIRWATDAVVEPDASARVAALADPELPDDTVVLSATPRRTPDPGTGAELTVVRDAGDTIEVEVTADGGGWLVVMDSLDDWSARVDGDPRGIVEADHAGGAVRLDAGTHRVVLSYTPRGLDTGLLVSGVAVVALVGLGALEISPRRRARGSLRGRGPSGPGRSSRRRGR